MQPKPASEVIAERQAKAEQRQHLLDLARGKRAVAVLARIAALYGEEVA